MPQAFSTPELHSPEPMLANMWANAIRLVRVALLRLLLFPANPARQNRFRCPLRVLRVMESDKVRACPFVRRYNCLI